MHFSVHLVTILYVLPLFYAASVVNTLCFRPLIATLCSYALSLSMLPHLLLRALACVPSSGGIPAWLGTLKSLEEVDLSATQLGGERGVGPVQACKESSTHVLIVAFTHRRREEKQA